MSSPNGNPSVNRTSPVSASTSVQNWSVNRPAVLPEHPKKQKITISIHNKLPVRPGQSQPGLLGSPLEPPTKPAPSSTITNSPAIQSTSSTAATAASSQATKPPAPTEPCTTPVMNGKARLHASVLVPYGAESSEESDEEAKGLGRENGLGVAQGAVGHESVPHELLRETVALNGADSAGSIPTEHGPSLDSTISQVQPALHSENPFAKANGLPGKVRSRAGWTGGWRPPG